MFTNKHITAMILAFFIFTEICLANLVPLTSKDGKTIQVEIVYREDDGVKVKREDGRKFFIPFDLLDEKSKERVMNWTDPETLLFRMLDDVLIYDSRYNPGDENRYESYALRIELSKAYGTFQKFTSSGEPEIGLNLSGLLFALSDYQYHKNVGLVIDQYDNVIFGEMAKIKRNWPEGLSDMSLSNFEELLEALYALNLKMEKQDRYFISSEVRSHARRLLFTIREHKSSLGNQN